jgi:uncharacterized protein (DUF1800 family)
MNRHFSSFDEDSQVDGVFFSDAPPAGAPSHPGRPSSAGGVFEPPDDGPSAPSTASRRTVLEAERVDAQVSRRAAARARAASHARTPTSVTRRTTLSLAGSGAALIGVAVATHKAPDTHSLDVGTRDIAARQKAATQTAAGTGTAGTGTAGTGKTKSGAKVEYQTTAAGKAPAANARASIKQPATILTLDPALHLARRATWGPTAQVVADIKRRGARAWLERQLHPASIPDATLAAYLRPFDTLGWTPAQLKAANDSRAKDDYWYAHDQLESAAIARAAWSERQLFEVTVDFFHSRLHVPAHIDKTRDTLTHYDTSVIRKHAFGTFRDMLWAMITHPAMIIYLDNQNNTKDGGNQNLGRELLELHTLGVDAGYKQADVAAVAVLLTGLGVDDKGAAMVYHPERHKTGAVRVFGKTFPNASATGGRATIKALIAYLAKHPKTAHYLALDMARRFVSDAPPKSLVDRLAAVYLKNDTAIVPMLRALFASPEFTHSVGQKYRRPLEHTAASIRALGIRRGDAAKFAGDLGDLRYWLERLGQAPLGRSTPDGYPDFMRPWLSTDGVLGRWNLDMSLTGQWRKGLSTPDITGMLAGATTYGAAVDRLVLRLTFQKGSAAQRAALLTFLGHRTGDALSADARKNDYRLRVQLPALILGGPHHQLR